MSEYHYVVTASWKFANGQETVTEHAYSAEDTKPHQDMALKEVLAALEADVRDRFAPTLSLSIVARPEAATL